MNYQIRPASNEEIPEILSLNRSAAARLDGTEHGSEIEIRLLKGDLLAEACNERRIWAAVDDDENLIGYGVVSEVGEHAYIEDISVAETAVRKGIGSSLAAEIYRWSVASEFETLSVSTYRDVVPALMFFFQLGYSIVNAAELDADLCTIRDKEAIAGSNIDTRVFLSIKTGVSKQSGRQNVRQATLNDIGQLTSIRHKTTETQIRIFSKGSFPGNFHFRPLHQILNSGQLFTAADQDGNLMGFSVVELFGTCLHISELAAVPGHIEFEITKDLLYAAVKGAKLAELPTVTVASFQLLNKQAEALRSLGFSQLNEDHAPPELRGILGREKHGATNSGRVYYWLNLKDHRKNR